MESQDSSAFSCPPTYPGSAFVIPPRVTRVQQGPCHGAVTAVSERRVGPPLPLSRATGPGWVRAVGRDPRGGEWGLGKPGFGPRHTGSLPGPPDPQSRLKVLAGPPGHRPRCRVGVTAPASQAIVRVAEVAGCEARGTGCVTPAPRSSPALGTSPRVLGAKWLPAPGSASSSSITN